jgi:hypothetical protein
MTFPEPLASLGSLILFAAPIVVAIVQALKYVGLPKGVAPLISMLIGIAIVYFLTPATAWNLIVLAGIIAGAIASGLWEAITPGASSGNALGQAGSRLLPLKGTPEGLAVPATPSTTTEQHAGP